MKTVEGVPLLDLKRSLGELAPELSAAFERVLKSGYYVMGPEIAAFEADCARYIGAKHAITVSSGTDALLLALMVLGIGPGDEVVCPTFTFFATAGTIWRSGARPAFADVRPCCFNTDAAAIERALTPRTKAIMPVHLFGQCAGMDPILALAKAKGVPVIEDAAQAIGAQDRGRGAGTMGLMGCFSFFPTKNLGGFGDGGLLTTEDDATADQARLLRTHGGRPKYYHSVVGANFRWDPLQAALTGVKLKRLDGYTEARRRNADLYTKLLLESGLAEVAPSLCRGEAPRERAAKLVLPPRCQDRHIFNQYTIRVSGEGERDRVRAHLAARKVETEIYYPVPMHLQQCFAALGHKPGNFPVAERAASEVLAVPIFPELTEDEIRYAVAGIVEALR